MNSMPASGLSDPPSIHNRVKMKEKTMLAFDNPVSYQGKRRVKQNKSA